MVTYEEMIRMIEDQRRPFTEERYDGYIIRHFDPGYPEHLFKWHWDEEDRTIRVVEDSDWRFQFDNQLPIAIRTGIDIKVPKGVIHRIIKGTTTLSLKIILD
jgi:hypothetical protein